jgi:pimeloyl-ACP methyl ester carboxylesterase
MKRVVLVICLAAVLALTVAGVAGAADPTQLNLPEKFSYIGSPVHSFTTTSGHVVHFIDQGNKDWRVAVLIGGAGTGVQAYELTQFARELQLKLHLRIICVERNGFGLTRFEPADAAGALIADGADDAALALADPVKTRELYAANVVEVLDHLDVNRFSVIAISGGGPFSAELARSAGARVRSIHLAVALHQSAAGTGYPDAAYLTAMKSYIIDPTWWWDMTGTTADKIPGWQERAYDEAAWSFFVRGQDADPHAVAMDYTIFQKAAPDVSMVTAPVFTYYGLLDTTVPPAQRDAWVAAYTASAKITQRDYPDGVHDVQYRHWDQILLDVAGYGKYLVIAYKGQTRVIPQGEWTWYRNHGAILGMQAWKTAKAPVD